MIPKTKWEYCTAFLIKSSCLYSANTFTFRGDSWNNTAAAFQKASKLVWLVLELCAYMRQLGKKMSLIFLRQNPIEFSRH